MIDAKRIEEMKRLTEETTPSPWSFDKGNSFRGDRRPAVIEHFDHDYGEWFIHGDIADIEDAQFIAESRQFVPDIIAAYEAQAEEIAKLREAFGFYADLSNYTEYYESDYVKYGERGTVDILSDKGGKAKEALAWRNTTRK